MDIQAVALLIVGMVLLVAGAEGLVRGASRLAITLGIPPLVVGLTIVAVGTSAPELAVSLSSAIRGDADIAVGNVVGSNILNVLLILGTAAVIAPLVVSHQLVRLEVPLMVGVSLLLLVLALNGEIGRLEGMVLVAGIAGYTFWAIRRGLRETAAPGADDGEVVGGQRSSRQLGLDALLIAGGLGVLLLGAHGFVEGATSLAEALGVSDVIIGLTVVAVGTSMPELATSVLASFRGERDIAVGNVVGSNLFNILGVLGVTAVVANGIDVADSVLRFDLPFMVAVAIACLPVFFTGRVIARWEGGLFLGYYVAYTGYLLLDASGHEAIEPYSIALFAFAVPITVLTLVLVVLREVRNGRSEGATGG